MKIVKNKAFSTFEFLRKKGKEIFVFKKNKRSKNSGFTLIEVIVSIVISTMILVSVMGSYWVLMKTNHSAEISRGIQKETNFAIIRMADTIRSHSIDFEGYSAGKKCATLDINSCQKLCVKNNFFEFKDDNLFMNNQPLFSAKYKVDDIYFSTAPSRDPFTNLGNRQFQIQPRTTIFIRVSSKENPSIKLEIQTTVSSRKYRK